MPCSALPSCLAGVGNQDKSRGAGTNKQTFKRQNSVKMRKFNRNSKPEVEMPLLLWGGGIAGDR